MTALFSGLCETSSMKPLAYYLACRGVRNSKMYEWTSGSRQTHKTVSGRMPYWRFQALVSKNWKLLKDFMQGRGMHPGVLYWFFWQLTGKWMAGAEAVSMDHRDQLANYRPGRYNRSWGNDVMQEWRKDMQIKPTIWGAKAFCLIILSLLVIRYVMALAPLYGWENWSHQEKWKS